MKLVHLAGPRLPASCIARSLRGPLSPTSTSTSRLQPKNPYQQHQFHAHRPLSNSATPETRKHHEEQPSQTPPLPLTDQVRLLMRRVPYPVSIITATDPTPSHHHHHNSNNPPELSYRGMTVSSFNTVTLIPEPVISFNVKRPSETLTALRSSGRFLAHLLAPNKATATLARDFSKGNHNLTILDGKGEFEFVGVDVESSHGGDGRKLKLPILRRRGANPPDGMEDFPFVFECRVMDKEMEVYDHTIVLATVVRALVEPPGVVGEGRKDLCLTYADTRFWGAGREI